MSNIDAMSSYGSKLLLKQRYHAECMYESGLMADHCSWYYLITKSSTPSVSSSVRMFNMLAMARTV